MFPIICMVIFHSFLVNILLEATYTGPWEFTTCTPVVKYGQLENPIRMEVLIGTSPINDPFSSTPYLITRRVVVPTTGKFQHRQGLLFFSILPGGETHPDVDESPPNSTLETPGGTAEFVV